MLSEHLVGVLAKPGACVRTCVRISENFTGTPTIGTDTGGSIRIPSAGCGVVGLKPTFGRVSRRGLLPLSTSLDHVGPLTRTVEDAALASCWMSKPCAPSGPGHQRRKRTVFGTDTKMSYLLARYFVW